MLHTDLLPELGPDLVTALARLQGILQILSDLPQLLYLDVDDLSWHLV